MTRGLFSWTAEDVIRFLKARGFALVHTRGSHFFYAGCPHGTYRQVTVPFHGKTDIKPRTLKGIILQSGISKDEWIKR